MVGDNYEAVEQWQTFWKWRQQGKGPKSSFPRCGSKHMESYFSKVTAMISYKPILFVGVNSLCELLTGKRKVHWENIVTMWLLTFKPLVAVCLEQRQVLVGKAFLFLCTLRQSGKLIKCWKFMCLLCVLYIVLCIGSHKIARVSLYAWVLMLAKD